MKTYDDKAFEWIPPSDMPAEEIKRVQELWVREGWTPPTECWVAEVRGGVFPYLGLSTAEPDGWYWMRDDNGADGGAIGGPYPTADAAKDGAYQAHKGATLVEICPTPEEESP